MGWSNAVSMRPTGPASTTCTRPPRGRAWRVGEADGSGIRLLSRPLILLSVSADPERQVCPAHADFVAHRSAASSRNGSSLLLQGLSEALFLLGLGDAVVRILTARFKGVTDGVASQPKIVNSANTLEARR